MSLSFQRLGSFWNDERITVLLSRMELIAMSALFIQLSSVSLEEFTRASSSSASTVLVVFRSVVSD